MGLTNHQFRLAVRPIGMPKATDWNYTEETVRSPGEGELLVKVLYVSLDPAMRGWMNDIRSYVEPVGIGEVMRAMGSGEVLESKDVRFAKGDYVTGVFGVQEYAIARGDSVTRIDPAIASLPAYLGVLGVPGKTAYFGLLDIGQPKPGETALISAASGAVGSVAGQIAKLKGCRVVGIAGGPQKCRYILDDLGFDAAIDYKTENVRKKLQEHCPSGIDIYFDNVGGEILDAALSHLARGARIVICGAVSQYNNTGPIKGPANYLSLLVSRARMQGMVVSDYASRFPEATAEMAGWMAEGKLKSREHVVQGLKSFPEALLKLFHGENLGKLVLKTG